MLFYFKITQHEIMAEVGCVMWNCSGVMPTSSTKEKIDFLEITTKNEFDILILIETHHKDENNLPTRLLRYKSKYHMIHTEASDGDPYAGIIVFIKKDFRVLQSTELIKGRLLNMKIKHLATGREYNVTPIYGYTAKDTSQAKMKFITGLLEKTHDNTEQNLILGDFNFVDNDLDRTSQSTTGMNQSDKTLSAPWVEFINKIKWICPTLLEKTIKKERCFHTYIHKEKPKAE